MSKLQGAVCDRAVTEGVNELKLFRFGNSPPWSSLTKAGSCPHETFSIRSHLHRARLQVLRLAAMYYTGTKAGLNGTFIPFSPAWPVWN
jgi:hypothetical protein